MCIDNDHGFLDQTQKKNIFSSSILLNSIIYLSQKMESEMDSKIKEVFNKLGVFSVLEKWLR